MLDEISYQFPSFNGTTFAVLEWISNFIPHFLMGIITWPCWNQSYSMLVKGAPVHIYGTCAVCRTVYPKKDAHGFCFAVLCCGYTLTDFPISIRLTSLALWQSNDCPSASKATLMNMDKYFMWIHYERLHNHNKAKHNKTVCIFLGIYCMDGYWATYHFKWWYIWPGQSQPRATSARRLSVVYIRLHPVSAHTSALA